MDSRGDQDPLPSWTPPDLRDWIAKFGPKFPEGKSRIYYLLARNLDMKEVWDWYGTATKQLPERYRSSVSFCTRIHRCKRMPGKPGNIPPKQRAEYLNKVRKHTRILIDLLADTKFDCGFDDGKYIEGYEEVEKSFARHLETAVDATTGGYDYFVAYNIDQDGASQLPPDYPDCHLVNLLHHVVQWTDESDRWGRNFVSSEPIRQAGQFAAVIQFNCIFYKDYLTETGVEIPFKILANIANVALELPYEEIISAETARKQVTRYLDRVGRPPLPLLEDTPF